MARRKSAEQPVERRPIPRWLIIGGAIAAIVTPLLGYCAARGGPEAIQELKEAAGYVKPPHIASVEPRIANKRRFLVSIENPSLRSIQITGYEAHPSIQAAASLSVNRAEEEKPEQCLFERKVSLRVPLVIAAKSAEGLEVEPWSDECDFSIRVEGTTGQSNTGFWVPKTIQVAKATFDSDPRTYRLMLTNADPSFVEHLIKNGLPDPTTIALKPGSSAPPPPPPSPPAIQTCATGAVIPVTDTCPPPPPPPPSR